MLNKLTTPENYKQVKNILFLPQDVVLECWMQGQIAEGIKKPVGIMA